MRNLMTPTTKQKPIKFYSDITPLKCNAHAELHRSVGLIPFNRLLELGEGSHFRLKTGSTACVGCSELIRSSIYVGLLQYGSTIGSSGLVKQCTINMVPGIVLLETQRSAKRQESHVLKQRFSTKLPFVRQVSKGNMCCTMQSIILMDLKEPCRKDMHSDLQHGGHEGSGVKLSRLERFPHVQNMISPSPSHREKLFHLTCAFVYSISCPHLRVQIPPEYRTCERTSSNPPPIMS